MVVTCGSQKFETKVFHDTLDPHWDEVFELEIDQAIGQDLLLEVYDYDVGTKSQHDFLGRLTIETEYVAKEGVVDAWQHLQDIEHGRLRLRAEWLTFNRNPAQFEIEKERIGSVHNNNYRPLSCGGLMIFIDSARGVPLLSHALSEPDPMAIVELGPHQTYTTKSEPSTTTPVWEEATFFFVADPWQQQLKITLKDEKSKAKLAEGTVRIVQLMEAPGMELYTDFAIKGAVLMSQCTVKLRLRLRALRNASIDHRISTDSAGDGKIGSDEEAERHARGLSQIGTGVSLAQIKIGMLFHSGATMFFTLWFPN